MLAVVVAPNPVQLPLSTLLSQALVAHTIEVDDQFEQRMPHSATVKNGAGLGGGGPWLVSQVMWSNYLRHIGPVGTPVKELQLRASVSAAILKSRLNHLSWWGYVTVGDVVTLTTDGHKACEVFEPLPSFVEERWRSRFDVGVVDELRASLLPFVAGARPELPHYLPVVDYSTGMRTEVVLADASSQDDRSEPDLSTLLAKTLLLFTLEFESESLVSLPHLVDVMRVIDGDGVSIKELPMRSGVSKEGMDAAVKFLLKAGLLASDGKGARAVLSLSTDGRTVHHRETQRLADVETSWEERHRAAVVARLRDALESILGHPSLTEGLTPHPDGWRRHKRYAKQTDMLLADPRAALPHHPMVLHRGGFPDGS